MQAAKPQIGCYMYGDDANKLSEYAKRVGVKRAVLVFLLVLRELKSTRLAQLRPKYPYQGKKEGLRRVTARLPSQSFKRAFEKHVAEIGMGSDEAAWVLFQTELAEQWLDKSLLAGNHP